MNEICELNLSLSLSLSRKKERKKEGKKEQSMKHACFTGEQEKNIYKYFLFFLCLVRNDDGFVCIAYIHVVD